MRQITAVNTHDLSHYDFLQFQTLFFEVLAVTHIQIKSRSFIFLHLRRHTVPVGYDVIQNCRASGKSSHFTFFHFLFAYNNIFRLLTSKQSML